MRVLAVAMALLLAAAGEVRAATLADAQAAYEQNRVADAERLYGAILADRAAATADRAAAERELGRIAWLIDGNAGASLAHLEAAWRLADRPCQSGALIARVLREAGRQADALRRGGALLASCDEAAGRDEIRLHLLGARLDLAAAAGPSGRSRRLAEAAAELAALSSDAAGGLDGAAARLEIGLASGDSGQALQGWRDYFWLTQADAPQSLADRGATGLFERGLGDGAGDADRLALLDLLVRAGFARQARRYAAATGLGPRVGGNPVWRRAEAYFEQRDRIDAATLRINRALARRRDTGDALAQEVRAATAALMAAADATGDPRQALLEHYGLYGTVGATSGYPSIHIGHVVEDRRERVVQYGRAAEVRFIAVDNMLGNGFETWLWDGAMGTGGWAEDGPTMIQVRPMYTSGPLLAAALLADTPQRRLLLARQSARAAEDLARLRNEPATSLRGLNDRLRLQLVDRIDAAARSKAGAGGDVRRAFLEEYWRASIQQSIMIHEGRHALDRLLAADASALDTLGLEFRAKLSELALADYPRLALTNLNSGTIGGDTPHGRAGAMVFDAFRRWIEAHAGEVIGYDPALPALVQLDKLTDDQIRAVARAEDPLAAGAVTPPS